MHLHANPLRVLKCPAKMGAMFSKHRLEALSDGIFAIVMTLLILDIKVPVDVPHGQLWEAIRHEGHTWISFVVTFALSSRYWVLQHKLFALIDHVLPRTLVTTFLFLGLITVLPFSTSLWGHHLQEPLAFVFYFSNQALIGVVILVELELARRGGNLHGNEAAASLRRKSYVMTSAMTAATVSIWFVPLEYVGLVAAAIGLIGNRLLKAFGKPLAATAPPSQ